MLKMIELVKIDINLSIQSPGSLHGLGSRN
jgi:hypothetical protein